MRSRNGNCPFILTLCGLICSIAYSSDEYYIGYRITAKNSQPIKEVLDVSKTMRPCGTQKTSASLTLIRINHESLASLLKREQTAFVEFAAHQEVHIKNNEIIYPLSTQSINALTLPTRCYAVEFNDDSVTITATQ